MRVVVLGVTGKQGGAVARRLLADGWQVRGVTRDPSGARAQALAAQGVEMVTAPSFSGVEAVFAVHPGPLAPELDEFADLEPVVKAAGDAHLVYSSALGADRSQPAKHAVEQLIADLGVSATVLRPSSFMENYLDPRFGLFGGELRTALNPGTRQQLIAVDDIAAFAALAFAEPDLLRGRTLDLAGDALTPPEIAAAVSAATGREVPYVHLPIEELRKVNPRFARGYELMNSMPEPSADFSELRKLHPELMTFETWLTRTGATQKLFRRAEN
ncbi:uncharacterized protein YbjT (DUF2867 family) [Amycolatopsis bartoniae]|uniref:NmrA family transcriptional regulator n=1 Tax=Amycolatopsis bartoniae TaxID=941986 RepID=A0A8H9J177_9PSEU|nr:NmrA family NAD(P)-binding protein [Amycolatopsis bartoniae]MBB2933352.1 uncharacterized protein YbjT (DUF2867 family) [Amycolatopsis bartoniae]TVT08045.1 NmrA/HSCARG family protein [Amycolatopsis bartoniae]GHF58895.1 NmrA family transcriptional regulator [Amycolatopsis bartoniae]